jgi:hypothetical protein
MCFVYGMAVDTCYLAPYVGVVTSGWRVSFVSAFWPSFGVASWRGCGFRSGPQRCPLLVFSGCPSISSAYFLSSQFLGPRSWCLLCFWQGSALWRDNADISQRCAKVYIPATLWSPAECQCYCKVGESHSVPLTGMGVSRKLLGHVGADGSRAVDGPGLPWVAKRPGDSCGKRQWCQVYAAQPNDKGAVSSSRNLGMFCSVKVSQRNCMP